MREALTGQEASLESIDTETLRRRLYSGSGHSDVRRTDGLDEDAYHPTFNRKLQRPTIFVRRHHYNSSSSDARINVAKLSDLCSLLYDLGRAARARQRKPRHRIVAVHIPATWTESMPFFFTSIAEFERARQDIDYLGIERFSSVGATRTQRHFQLSTLKHTALPDEAKLHRRLLGNSWEEIFPKLQQWSEMAGTKEGWRLI
jgi:hypothetical protein